MQNVKLITGATCCGKTKYAIDLAQHNNSIIINSDAFQVYQDIPIISAQPTIEEKQNIPHVLFGFLSGKENLNAYDMIQNIAREINNNSTKDIIITGGTPMYQYLILTGISQIPPISEDTKNKIADIPEEKKYKLLITLDSQAKKLHENDTSRIHRSLEVFLETGRSIFEWQKDNIKLIKNHIELIIIPAEKNILIQKATERLNQMISDGCLEEIEKLMSKKYDINNNVFKAHGVREFISYIEGNISLEDAKKSTLQRIKQYQKHQLTWMKKIQKEYFNITKLS